MTVRVVLSAFMLALALHAGADDKKEEKIDTKLIVGKWMEVGGPKVEFEFTKDGKAIASTIVKEEKATIEGTYKLEGNKLTLTAVMGKSRTLTITKLTGTELVVTPENGKVMTFERPKDK